MGIQKEITQLRDEIISNKMNKSRKLKKEAKGMIRDFFLPEFKKMAERFPDKEKIILIIRSAGGELQLEVDTTVQKCRNVPYRKEIFKTAIEELEKSKYIKVEVQDGYTDYVTRYTIEMDLEKSVEENTEKTEKIE